MKNQLLDKWSNKGTKAARQDTWMEPCYEEDAGRAADLSDLVLAHRQRWESTDYFQIVYGQEMLQDVAEVGRPLDWETRCEAKMDLLDMFWDAWELEIGAYDLAREAMETA